LCISSSTSCGATPTSPATSHVTSCTPSTNLVRWGVEPGPNCKRGGGWTGTARHSTAHESAAGTAQQTHNLMHTQHQLGQVGG
jgi:hypothetical protein